MIHSTLLLFSLLSLSPQDAGTDAPAKERSFRFVYSAALKEVPTGARQVRMWIPIPLDTPDQEITGLTLRASSEATKVELGATTPDELQDGKQDGLTWTARDVQGGSGRSLCLETAGKPIQLELAFDVLRRETKGGGKASPEELAELKQPDKMIPLDGKVSAIAASIKTTSDAREAARTLYLHTLERMKYDKPEGDKGWGRGDAEWACDARYGNCTDFHSYYMGLARTKGIPARFEMGFPVPGGPDKEAKVGGYHCWAYVWVEGSGWVPVDISEADKQPEKAEYFFGTLDANRVTMTGGRDLVLDPAPAAGTLNFFVYPYAEIDGKPAEGVKKEFKRIDP